MLYVNYPTPSENSQLTLESNPFIAALFNDAPDAIFILDSSSHSILDCNDKALELFEAETKSSLIDLPSFRLYESEPIEFSRNLLEMNIKNSGEHTQELAFRTLKQNIFWGKLKKRSIKIDDQEYFFLRISKALDYLRSEETLSTLLRGTAKVTGAKYFKELTKLLCRTFDVKYALVIKISSGSEYLKVIQSAGSLMIDSSTRYPVKMSVMENVLKGYTTFYPHGVNELFPADNFVMTNRIEGFMGTPIFGNSGEVTGILAFMNDIPIQEIPNSRYILSIFASRTAAEIQRMRSKEILKEQARDLSTANNVKDRLLNIITNDLIQPLHALMGFTENLRTNAGKYDKDKLLNKIDIVDNSVRNINFMFENLAEWSKIYLENIRPKKQKLLLYPVVEEHIKLFGHIAAIKKIAIRNDLQKCPEVNADINMLGTIFRNFLSTAVKFAERESEIVIDHAVDNKEVVINIALKGAGFSEEDIEMIMKSGTDYPVFRPDCRDIPGMGLTLAKNLIERMNGKISISSDPESLTVVSFSIPA